MKNVHKFYEAWETDLPLSRLPSEMNRVLVVLDEIPQNEMPTIE